MKDLEKSKEYYDNIEIPKELDSIVNQIIDNNQRAKGDVVSMKDYANKKKLNSKSKTTRIFVTIGSLVAASLVIVTVALNTSQTFAQEMSRIPVIGVVAKVLTVRSYEEQKDNVNISVNVPGIEENKDNEFVADVNAEIQKHVDEYVKDAEIQIADYKKAFFETGGTQEQWEQRKIEVNVNYDVKYQDNKKVSFVLTSYESWASFTEVRLYYNLDLVNNKRLTLKDLLGEDYINIANKQIVEQINANVKEFGYVYWGFEGSPDMGSEGFKTIDENTQFYINEKGNVVIAFEKYSIGPGYMGVQEFEIIK